MEYFANQTSWQLPQESIGQASGERHLTDDWSKVSAAGPTTMTNNGVVNGHGATYSQSGPSTMGPPTMDMDGFNELTTVPPGQSSSSSSQSTSPAMYWPYPQPAFYYPYPNSYTLPVSSYSSLNGATASPHTQPHQLDLDPVLVSGASSSHANGSIPSMYQYQSGTQEHHQPHLPTYTINPSVLQNHQPSQQPLVSTTPTPLSRSAPKADLRDVLKPLLTPSKLTGSSAVGIIVKLLQQYGPSEIAADVRIDLFSKISVQADDQFFKAWVDNSAALDITREWLKAGAVDRHDGPLKASVNPILSAIGRMRFTIEGLKAAKLGKIIVKLTKDLNSATRDLSLDLEKKWRGLLNDTEPSVSARKADEIDDGKPKKRKLSDTTTTRLTPPAKRLALASTPAVKLAPARKEPKVVVTNVKDAKSDSSFFSKPKSKLPSFKKSTTATSATTTAQLNQVKEPENVALPSSFDPFKDVLMSLKRNSSPKVESRSTPPLGSQTSLMSSTVVRGVSRKKTVTFAPDGQLEQIKFIERAIYDDDPTDNNMIGMHSLRDLDRGEGAALHAHILEEQLDWTEPLLLDLPVQAQVTSVEAVNQAKRESNTLNVKYMSAQQIPDSPSEPLDLPPEDPDIGIRSMTLGQTMDDLPLGLTTDATISDLLGQITSNLTSNGAHLTSQLTGASSLQSNIAASLSHLSNEQVGLLVQQLSGGNGVPSTAIASDNWAALAAMTQGNDGFDYNVQDRQSWDAAIAEGFAGDRGGSRGRGRGRGRGSRRPCSFFLQGRCRYGDQCDYSHDITL